MKKAIALPLILILLLSSTAGAVPVTHSQKYITRDCYSRYAPEGLVKTILIGIAITYLVGASPLDEPLQKTAEAFWGEFESWIEAYHERQAAQQAALNILLSLYGPGNMANTTTDYIIDQVWFTQSQPVEEL